MARKKGNPAFNGSKRRRWRKSFRAVCADCGKEVVVEVSPPAGESLICLDCYKK